MKKSLIESQVLQHLADTASLNESITQEVYDKQHEFFNKCLDLSKKLRVNVNINNAVANENLTNASFGSFSKAKDTFAFIRVYPSKGDVTFEIILNSNKKEDQNNFGRVKQSYKRKLDANYRYPISKIGNIVDLSNYREDFDMDVNKLKEFAREIKKIKY